LAVDPYTGEIDQEVLVMALEKLGRASGHPDLGRRWAQNTIPVLLASVVGSVETATAWVELIATFSDFDAEQVRRVADELTKQRHV